MYRVRKFAYATLTLAVTCAMVLFLIFPARYTESVRNGISLWAVSVLPATLPFLSLTALFTRLPLFKKLSKKSTPLMNKLFGISGTGGGAVLLSLVSGYPVGARTVQDLAAAGQLEKDEIFRTACLASTSGPAFIVGVVGAGMLQNAALGWLIYFSHLMGILAVGLILRLNAKPIGRKKLPAAEAPPDLGEILINSILSILTVGAAIAIFYVFGQMIADMGAFVSLSPRAEGVIRGLLEMTTGCALLGDRTPLSLALQCFLITFGGLCVLVQQLAFLTRAGVKALPFLGVKLLQGAVSALVCFGLALLFL